MGNQDDHSDSKLLFKKLSMLGNYTNFKFVFEEKDAMDILSYKGKLFKMFEIKKCPFENLDLLNNNIYIGWKAKAPRLPIVFIGKWMINLESNYLEYGGDRWLFQKRKEKIKYKLYWLYPKEHMKIKYKKIWDRLLTNFPGIDFNLELIQKQFSNV